MRSRRRAPTARGAPTRGPHRWLVLLVVAFEQFGKHRRVRAVTETARYEVTRVRCRRCRNLVVRGEDRGLLITFLGRGDLCRGIVGIDQQLGEFELQWEVRKRERSIGQVLPDWLDVNGIAVLQIPAVPHAEVVARDLAVRASFVRSGKGYRDALIWHSFLEWADTVPGLGVDTMYFVTSNTQDFCAPSGGLKRELLAELPAAVSVEVLQRPQDLSAKLNLLTSLTTETIVTECALRLIDTALVHEPVDNDLHHWSTVVEEVTVSEVFADDGVPELVETLAGETQLWRVEISAELGVTGYVYKGDLGGLDGSLSVVDPDWNDHYVEVSGRVACTVAVLVRIEADLETCEAEIMELIA